MEQLETLEEDWMCGRTNWGVNSSLVLASTVLLG